MEGGTGNAAFRKLGCGWLKAERIRQEREERDQADFHRILDAYRFRGYDKGVRGIHMRLLHTGVVDFALETVEKLVKHHGGSLSKKTILHSDQGRRYTCVKFIQLLKNRALRQSMSRRGDCWDDAPQESWPHEGRTLP